MKCPLLQTGLYAGASPWSPDAPDCLKEECAWWNTFIGECAVSMLALEVNHLRAALQKIEYKMPPHVQEH